jgi:hypothetical protein
MPHADRIEASVRRHQPARFLVKAIVSKFAGARDLAEVRFVLPHKAIRAWPIFLLLSHATAYGADTACRYPLVTEQQARAKRFLDELDDYDTRVPIVRRDINLDGREDLLIGHRCGNHACDYRIYLGRADGKYCRVVGGLGMSVAGETGLIDVRLEGSKPRTITIVTASALSADGAEYEIYRLANGILTRLCSLSYIGRGDPSDPTDEEVERFIAGGAASCRHP